MCEIATRRRAWPQASEQLAPPEFTRCRAGPFLEGAVKGAALGKAELQADLHGAPGGVRQIADGKVAPQLILDDLVRGALIVQAAAQCRRGQVELLRQRLELDQLAWQTLAQAASGARPEAAAVLVLDQDV